MRTLQRPNFSFQRSSTPIPYSFGKPALNCCGGSLSTFGNMKRPVAESAATEAAVNEPHARFSHARRETSGDVSSGSRDGTFAATAAGLVVLPARSTAGAAGAGGFGGAAGTGIGGVVSSAIWLSHSLQRFKRGLTNLEIAV